MARSEYQIEVGLNTVTMAGWDERELELDVDDLLHIKLADFKEGILSFLERCADGAALKVNVDKTTGQQVVASLTFWCQRGVLPWEHAPALVIVDFSDRGQPDALSIQVTCPHKISEERLVATVESTLRGHSSQFIHAEYYSSAPTTNSLPPWVITCLANSDHSLREIFQMRQELAHLAFFPRVNHYEPRLIIEMLRAGIVDNLIGMTESDCLEFKSCAYDMKEPANERWKHELAQDVARFANSERGGVLVIGVSTKRIDGDDTALKISPIPRKATRIQSYRQILDSRIHPPISSIEIESVPVNAGEVLFLFIPPQQEFNKPYLVQGGVIEGKYDAGLISIVRRRGEASIPVTAREIHTMLATGRAVLRGQAAIEQRHPS
ncbi:AlbA family DNA-binding domain-containing protein [Actinomadura nitritigenes]|uniref:AlbA family DNA-binding domain-containing protein n=1 Tax=Actinomadura nitritigenes TaxID=134602 RepID=UPI003D919869